MPISVPQLAYIKWLFEQESTRQNNIATYRDYYDGEHSVMLSDRQREYLELHGTDVTFCLNVCKVVVDALADRLRVTGFRVALPPSQQDDEDGPAEDDAAMQPMQPPAMPMQPAQPGEAPPAMPEFEPPKKPEKTPEQEWSEVVNEWWQDNRGDALQRKEHKAALRDGMSYLVVDWDNAAGRPRLNFQPAYTSYGDSTSNGQGVKVHTGADGKIVCASKRWKVNIDDDGKIEPRRYMNLYFPNRVEKYYTDDEALESNWQERVDPEDAINAGEIEEGDEVEATWPQWWTDTGEEGGAPLGIPVFPLINDDQGYTEGTSELAAVIPMQDAINKTLVDMLANADYAAFRIYTQSGGEEPDGAVFPGAFMWNADPETRIAAIEAGGNDHFLTSIDRLIQWTAAITRTPQYLFYASGALPSGESLKTSEAGLIMKAKDRQVGFGNAYEAAMSMAVKLANTFGDGVDIPDGAIITCLWDDPATRTSEEARAKADFMVSAGYEEEALRIMGYDDAEIERLKREKDAAKASSATLGMVMAQQARARFEQGGPPAGMPGAMQQPQAGQVPPQFQQRQ